MKVITLTGVGHEANTYVLISGGAAAVVDPAVSEERVLSVLEKENATLTAILLTHGHADHTLTLGALRAKTGAPLMVGAEHNSNGIPGSLWLGGSLFCIQLRAEKTQAYPNINAILRKHGHCYFSGLAGAGRRDYRQVYNCRNPHHYRSYHNELPSRNA